MKHNLKSITLWGVFEDGKLAFGETEQGDRQPLLYKTRREAKVYGEDVRKIVAEEYKPRD